MTLAERYQDGHYLEQNPTWHVEDSPWKARQVLKMLSRHDLRPRVVAEIGCGAGAILRQLHDQMEASVRFVGYEISPQAYELARRRESARLSFHLRDLLGPEAATDGTFDLVLAMDVIEHVEDLYGFLRRLRRAGEYKIFHIPLDISVYSALGPTLMRGRRALGPHPLTSPARRRWRRCRTRATRLSTTFTPSAVSRRQVRPTSRPAPRRCGWSAGCYIT